MEKGEDIKSVLYLKDGQIKWSRGGSLPGQEIGGQLVFVYRQRDGRFSDGLRCVTANHGCGSLKVSETFQSFSWLWGRRFTSPLGSS